MKRSRVNAEAKRLEKQELLTDELLSKIIHSKSPEGFLGQSVHEPKDLSQFLCTKLDELGLRKSDVIRQAQLNETFGYQIFSGQRHPGRNKVLALSLAFGFNLHDTRKALSHADVGDLNPKNRRDAIIMFCVSHGYNLARTDKTLYDFGEETISDAGDK